MQGATPSNNEQLRDEIQIHLENVTDPWTSSQRIDACSNRMKDSSVRKFIPVESSIWPEMQDGVLRISVKNWTDDELATFRAMQP